MTYLNQDYWRRLRREHRRTPKQFMHQVGCTANFISEIFSICIIYFSVFYIPRISLFPWKMKADNKQNQKNSSKREAKRENNCSWKHVLEEKRVLLAFWGHLEAIGMQTCKRDENCQKTISILRQIRRYFEVLEAAKIL